MSCGRPHSTPCPEVLSNVYEFLDGELDISVREQIVHHLDECPPCMQQFALEQMVKSLVRRSCCDSPAPEELRVRVIARIQEVRITYRRGL